MAYEMVMPYHLHMPSYFLETFTEYPYVIIEAKALLISSNLTIQEICYKLNFSTPSSFTRFFKRITGMSPRKFRTLKVFPNLIE